MTLTEKDLTAPHLIHALEELVDYADRLPVSPTPDEMRWLKLLVAEVKRVQA